MGCVKPTFSAIPSAALPVLSPPIGPLKDAFTKHDLIFLSGLEGFLSTLHPGEVYLFFKDQLSHLSPSPSSSSLLR